MDYEKKYKSLVEAVKTLKEANPSDEGIQNWVKDNVPELQESEDERIRKALLNEFIHLQSKGYKFAGLEGEDILAWLERQGEQKHYGQREECLDCQVNYAGECKGSCKLKRNEQKSQRIISAEAKEAMYGKPAWSEEDEEHVNSLLKRLEGLCCKEFAMTRFAINEDEDWLKSLKDRMKGE